MNTSKSGHVLGIVMRLVGRAMLGAVAGIILVPLALLLTTEYFRLFTFENSPAGTRAAWVTIGLGVVMFALIAVVFGKSEIKGRAGAVIKGVLSGTVMAILGGTVLAHAVDGKAMAFAAILLGGPLGAIIGGIVGCYTEIASQKPAPPLPDSAGSEKL